MQFTTSFLAGSALIGAASAGSIQGRQTTSNCATGVHVIAAGGSNYTDEYAYGRILPLVQSITSAIPGSDNVSMPYNKVEPTQNKLYPTAVPQGIITFGNYVNEYHASCPDTKIVTIGYSAGAVITMSGLCDGNVPQDLAGTAIVANILYGDETRTPGQPYDLGTCTKGKGTQPRNNTAECGTFIPITQSYCDFNDPRCCGGPADDYAIHFVYPGKYDGVATQFVVSQFNKLGGGNISSSASSSMSATASSSATGSLSSSVSGSATSASATGSATGAAASSASASLSSAISSAVTSADSQALATAASSAATSLTPANGNSGAFVVPSFVSLGAACAGAMLLLGAALL